MQGQIEVNSSILERFEFRDIRQEEADQAVLIEKICFPPNEACSPRAMKERIAAAPELFLVAVDKDTGYGSCTLFPGNGRAGYGRY